jgi:hypothetical protein
LGILRSGFGRMGGEKNDQNYIDEWDGVMNWAVSGADYFRSHGTTRKRGRASIKLLN